MLHVCLRWEVIFTKFMLLVCLCVPLSRELVLKLNQVQRCDRFEFVLARRRESSEVLEDFRLIRDIELFQNVVAPTVELI